MTWAAIAAEADLPAALAQAQARRAAVVIDFHAPWCYSCYFMARNVLTGTDWERVREQSVILDVDVDSPEGPVVREFGRYYFILNAGFEELDFHLPALLETHAWHRLVDTSLDDGSDFLDAAHAEPLRNQHVYRARTHSTVILVNKVRKG